MAEGAEREPEAAGLARAAMREYRASVGRGDPETGLRWLDRAHRLVPRDPNIMLALAGNCLGRDPVRAAELFSIVTASHDVREAWLGLTAAQLRLGATDQALISLGHALSRHVPRNDTRSVANQIVRVTGADGWCGVSFDGVLVIHAAARTRPVVALDGTVLNGTRLPAEWTQATRLMVMVEGRHLIGSPIDIAAIRRTEGVVEADQGSLRGWAWHPADPGRRVILSVSDGIRPKRLRVVADDASVRIPDLGPLAHPLGFRVSAEDLARFGDQLHVTAPDGRSLYGSPIAPLAELRAAAATARQIATLYPARAVNVDAPTWLPTAPMPADLPVPALPAAVAGRTRPAAVIIPVHGQRELTLACLESVLDTVDTRTRVIVVDDASPDAGLQVALDELARTRRIRLLRNDRNLGFAASVNLGVRACPGRDVVLLNSDTLVPPGWLDRLRDAAYATRDIGTVTPLSNDASILSYPDPASRNPAPDRTQMLRLDAMARAVAGSDTIDIPVGVGFCLYIRRDCLSDVGVLRDDIFAQGYGEENDFCLRARRLGWRHIALPSLYVAHRGGQSFSQAGAHLRARNAQQLERLHPGYHRLVQDFLAADPLAPFRRKLDLRRWSTRRPRHRHSAILVTHDESGGVEQRVRRSAAAHVAAERNAVILRPARMADGTRAVEISDSVTGRYPNLRFAMPAEWPALLRLLRAQRPMMTEVHHFLGHDPVLHDLPARLGLPYDVRIHDYALLCPRILLVDGRNRYCGEPPDKGACEACVSDHGRFDHETIGVAALRERSARLLAGARHVIAPSEDTARRMARHFPGLTPMVIPHEDDDSIPARLPRARRAAGRRRVCVLGAIGIHKGYEILLACARDAADRNLDLDFVVVGSTIDDARLIATGRAFITGVYDAEQAVALIWHQDADLGFLPSIAPETWCMGLTELWRAGLRVAAFDIGAPAERIKRTGRGFLLPPHLPPGAINNALINAMASSEPRGIAATGRTVSLADLSHIVAKGP
jgi:GT2 family glycosyltransferase